MRELKQRAEKAEAACAEMREALVKITHLRWGWDGDCGALEIAERALDSDCGKVSLENVRKLREALEKIAALQYGKYHLLEGGCQRIAKQALEETK